MACGPSSPFRRLTTAHEKLASYIHACAANGPSTASVTASDAIREAALTRTAAFRSAFARVHVHARGPYDLEEAAPRPTEHALGRAAYRSRSASRVAAHEVGVATGRSDGRTFPTVIEGEMRNKRTNDSFSVALRRRLPPPCSTSVRTVRASDAKGPSMVNGCPSPPMPFVRPSERPRVFGQDGPWRTRRSARTPGRDGRRT